MSEVSAPIPARPRSGRPADFEGVVCAEEIRTKRLVVCDDDGRARIVTELRRGVTEVRIAVDAEDGRRPMMVLVAGDDPHFGPSLGLSLFAGGDEVAAFDTGEGPDGEWRTGLSGVGLTVAD